MISQPSYRCSSYSTKLEKVAKLLLAIFSTACAVIHIYHMNNVNDTIAAFSSYTCVVLCIQLI